MLTKLTEAKEVLSAMKEGSTNAPKPQTGNSRRGMASSAKANNNAPPDGRNSDDPPYTVQMFKGQKYYHFPDLDTKQKCVAEQQNEVAQNEELVKKLDDSKQGLLNFVKNGGPELQLKSVGDLGFVSNCRGSIDFRRRRISHLFGKYSRDRARD